MSGNEVPPHQNVFFQLVLEWSPLELQGIPYQREGLWYILRYAQLQLCQIFISNCLWWSLLILTNESSSLWEQELKSREAQLEMSSPIPVTPTEKQHNAAGFVQCWRSSVPCTSETSPPRSPLSRVASTLTLHPASTPPLVSLSKNNPIQTAATLSLQRECNEATRIFSTGTVSKTVAPISKSWKQLRHPLLGS